MISLRRRLEALEDRLLPKPGYQLLGLACAAMDGDEGARQKFIEVSARYRGTARLAEVFYPLFDSSVDQEALRDESDDFGKEKFQ